MSERVSVAILGASGYGGGELLRLLADHPGLRVTQIASRHHAGKPAWAVHRHLLGVCDLSYAEDLDLAALLADGPAFLISALPTGHSATALRNSLGAVSHATVSHAAAAHAAAAPAELPAASTAGADCGSGSGVAGEPDLAWPEGLRVIDLSGDLRLRDAEQHVAHYPRSPLVPELRARARYGLVELNRETLRTAELVSNPGCFATALSLGLAPLVASGLCGFVAADGKTGSSGSGALPSETAHHPTRHSDFRAYGLGGHAHTGEVAAQFAGSGLRLSFVPHSAPLVRGIFVTLHAPRESFRGAMPDLDAVRAFYAGEPMIRVREDSPRVLDVAGTNFCDLTLVRHETHVVVCAALDNLGKGMAGQAVQTLNLWSGLPETTGLRAATPWPI